MIWLGRVATDQQLKTGPETDIWTVAKIASPPKGPENNITFENGLLSLVTNPVVSSVEVLYVGALCIKRSAVHA